MLPRTKGRRPVNAKDIIARLEALLSEAESATVPLPEVIRPAMSPFDVELDPDHVASVAREIEALNKALAAGNRGYFDVPTGHANAIKCNFEAAVGKDGRRWRVEISSVNPTFAKIFFVTDHDPVMSDK